MSPYSDFSFFFFFFLFSTPSKNKTRCIIKNQSVLSCVCLSIILVYLCLFCFSVEQTKQNQIYYICVTSIEASGSSGRCKRTDISSQVFQLVHIFNLLFDIRHQQLKHSIWQNARIWQKCALTDSLISVNRQKKSCFWKKDTHRLDLTRCMHLF